MRFSRFILIGGVCALLNNILVIGLSHCGIHYLGATLLAFGPVLVVGYALHTVFTFEAPASWLSFGRYALAMAANYPIWIVALYTFCDLLGFSVTIAAPVTTTLVMLWNYSSARWALFVAPSADSATTPSSIEGSARWIVSLSTTSHAACRRMRRSILGASRFINTSL